MSNKWQTSNLGELVNILVSNVDKKIFPEEHSALLCNYMDVYRNDYITLKIPFSEGSANTNEIVKFSLEKGDIIITKDSETPEDIAVPAVVTEELDNVICGYHLAILRPKSANIDSTFLMNLLKLPSIQNQFFKAANGITRFGLTIGSIENVLLRYPHQKAQHKIAKVLTTVDNLIEKTDTLIAKYESIKQGMMHDLFTRGVDENGQLRPPVDQTSELYKDSELGWIPKEWDLAPLSNFSKNIPGSFVNGPFGSDLLTSELKTEGVPVIYVRDIKSGFYERVSTAYVTPSKANQLQVCNVLKGDVLIAKVGDPPCDTAPYVLNEKSIITQDVIRMRPASDVDTFYIANLLNSPFGRSVIRKIIIEGTRARVSLSNFKTIVMPKPNLQEQKRIRDKLKSVQNMIFNYQKCLRKYEEVKKALMQDLLTGKVRVKVDEPEEVEASA